MRRIALFVVAALGAMTACADDGNDTARDVPTRNVTPAYEDAAPADEASEPEPEAAVLTSLPATVGSEPPVEPTGVVVSVIALDNSFRPELVEIAVGDEVEWENRGINEHNVLRVEGDGWGVEVADFQPGATYSHVFTEPGEYRYYCSIHGNTEVGMVGTILVRG